MPNLILNGHPQQHSDLFLFLEWAIKEGVNSV